MNLYLQRDIPRHPHTDVFRQSWRGSFIWACFLFGLSAFGGFVIVATNYSIVAICIAGPLIALYSLIGALCAQSARAALRPSSWLARVSPDGLLIQFRSYGNAHFPDVHPSVVWIGRQEIECIRLRVEEHSQPSRNGSVSHRNLYLDLWVSSPTEPLHAAIERERAYRPPRTGLVSHRTRHAPVRVSEPGVVRLAWRGGGSAILPRTKQALEILGRSFAIGEAEEFSTDWKTIAEADLDDHVLELAERGERMAALTILHKRRNMSISEAVRFIRELEAKP